MKTNRDLVLSALSTECGYHNKTDLIQNNYIDGMCHVGMLLAAAGVAGDVDLLLLSRTFISELQWWDVRAYGPEKLTGSWEEVKPGLYGLTKAQSFAGPCAYAIATGDDYANITKQAVFLVWSYRIMPFLFRWTPLKQHLNSVMLAHLLIGENPTHYVDWLCKDNPVFAYICGVKLESWKPYPDVSSFPPKNIPFMSEAEREAERRPIDELVYTPTCALVGEYLQGSM